MPMHLVEVDDEVFAFVQKHAHSEPPVDNFNSALRRILSSGQATVGQGQPVPATSPVNGGEGYDILVGAPQALGQILDVVQLVGCGSASRTGATRQVAKKRSVAPQTVLDKYTRQLGLTAAQFDRLLAPERCEELRRLLYSKFPGHVDAVDQVLGASVTGQETPHQEHLVHIAEGMFGPGHGVELAIPPRGTAPHRPLPDFSQPERDR